jgi:hypothetical protein
MLSDGGQRMARVRLKPGCFSWGRNVMGLRRVCASILVALALVGLGSTPAQGVPSPEVMPVITATCEDEQGADFSVDVVTTPGAIVFVLDASGEPTGEKLFLLSIDAEAFSDDGTLVGEFSKTYGQRRGHGEPISCSGSFVEEDGVTVFFEVVVTRR